jgi:hypothetical protein
MKTHSHRLPGSIALVVALAGLVSVTSGCSDPGPDEHPDAQTPVDAAVTCQAGDLPRCTGTLLEICGPGDTWMADRECGDVGCNATAHRCNACDPAVSSGCQHGAVIACSDEGLVLSEQPCDHGCRLAGAVAECTACTAGVTECVGDVWTTCDALGQPAAELPCEHGCSDVLQGCQECVAGDLACQGADLVACGVLGLDEERITCEHGCSAEALVCQCEASTSTCEGDVLHHCGADALPAGSEICALGCNADRGACNECLPGQAFCDGDAIGTCSAEGLVTSLVGCPLGCNAWALPQRCFTFDPTYAEEADLHDISVTWPTASTLSINTGTCVLTAGAVTLQGEIRLQDDPAPDLCVFRFADITIAYNQSVRVTGSNGLVLVSAQSIAVYGMLDGSAHGATPGPGGRSSASAGTVTGDGGNGSVICSGMSQTGGGGGGHGAVGGTGGALGAVTGGAGGPVTGSSSLQPILAGSRGGYNGTALPSVGAGGGVIVLVAWSEILVGTTTFPMNVAGVVDVSGGGGQNWGVGGGSGGSILMEAPLVTVSGTIRGAGGGGACSNTAGADGRSGGLGCTASSSIYASGGRGGGYYSGVGNFIIWWPNGVAGESKTACIGNNLGGGGGATGRLLINAAGGANGGVHLDTGNLLLLTTSYGFISAQ